MQITLHIYYYSRLARYFCSSNAFFWMSLSHAYLTSLAPLLHGTYVQKRSFFYLSKAYASPDVKERILILDLRSQKERDDREARELADTRYFYGKLAEQKLRDADNKLLTHAAELLQEARDHGRPEYALHEAIDVSTYLPTLHRAVS